MKVTTYQSPTGSTINVCHDCEVDKVRSESGWWRDTTGQEYCTCSHGLHDGECDFCGEKDRH
jgi:hypothetical protein